MPSSNSKSTGTYLLLGTGAVIAGYAGTNAYQSRIRKKFDDGIDIKNQTVEIDPVERIRRCTYYKDIDIYNFYKAFCPGIQTVGDVFYHGYETSKNGPCIGFVNHENKTEPIYWISYGMALERIRKIGSHLWTNAKLTPMKSTVAILSSNRAEYSFVEHASYMYGFIVLALYTTYDSRTILSILKKTQTDVLVVDNLERIDEFKNELFQETYLKEILVMDKVTDANMNSKIRDIPTVLETMTNSDVRSRPKVDPESIATYILTSGTTGEPKIAMLSHTNILATVKAGIDRRQRCHMTPDPTNRHCSFLPLAHLYERLVLTTNFLNGTQVIYCPIPEKIFEYYPIVKPTNICMVPRVLNKVYDTIMAEVNKNRIKRFLITQALKNDEPSLFSRLVFRRVRQLFGGEAIAMVTGSAPITPEVLHFFRIALDIPIVEGYGQTESAAAGTTTHLIDTSSGGTVGSPGAAVEIKLIDVPGTNYRSENNQGEICIRGPTVFKGYYLDEAKTRETIDEGGWLHTGDVGEWTSNGALRVIDRTKHIFKLNQGEYIAPERLEDIYVRSRWISQVFVDGISTESNVVAIVVPDEEYLRKQFPKLSGANSIAEICRDEKLKQTILKDMQRLAKDAKFKYYETVSNIYLHSEPFTQENGLVTSTMKTRRTAVRHKFQQVIHSLYASNEQPTSNTDYAPISKL